MAETQRHPWGRADETGTVFVREGDEWREVGQFPDGSPAEALAYFERKYADIEGQVALLEQRAKRGAPAADIAKAVTRLQQTLDHPNAVGDIAALKRRVDALDTTVDKLDEKQREEAEKALSEAVDHRTRIVEAMEELAAREPERVQWKHMTAQVSELFAQWQAHQHDGPRLPKSEANALWKRFRNARTTVERERRAFFASLDAQHKEARRRKQELIDDAEKLVARGADAASDYRRLVDEWKRAGRAGKKHDDGLWARFKAAGDSIFAAKAEVDAADDEEHRDNLEKKKTLLTEAEGILDETDPKKAKARLLDVQTRWEEIGRVPRDSVKTVEGRLRRVEQAVRKLDDEHWERNDPEKLARSEGLAAQLVASMSQLEAEITAAREAGDERRIAEVEEALATQRQWLEALE